MQHATCNMRHATGNNRLSEVGRRDSGASGEYYSLYNTTIAYDYG